MARKHESADELLEGLALTLDALAEALETRAQRKRDAAKMVREVADGLRRDAGRELAA